MSFPRKEVQKLKYKITTGSLKVEVEAENPQEAIRKFFATLKVFWHKWRDKIGQLALVHDPHDPENESKMIAFRLVPALYRLGLLDEEEAVANLLKVFGEPPTADSIREAKIMLLKLSDEDKWMVETREHDHYSSGKYLEGMK